MVFKFQGDTETISNKQLAFIENVLKEKGVNEGNVVIEPVGREGDNFVADVRRIIASRNGESFSIVVKIKPPSIEPEKISKILSRMFRNEYFIYSNVLKRCKELEDEFDVPEKERLITAECYGALLEEDNEVIVLEDLRPKQFVMLDRSKGLPEVALKLMLQSLARMHACVFTVHRKEPKLFETWKNDFDSPWETMTKDEVMKTMFVKSENYIIDLIDEKYEKYLRGTITRMGDITAALTKEEKNSVYTTIHHGDAWINNAMFRIEDDNILSCCMIDYQISRVASPARDLGYMIFNCTEYQQRKDHYLDWIDYYHSELDKALDNFGLDANIVYSRDRLDDDIRRYAKLTIALTTFTSTIMVRDCKDSAKLSEKTEDAVAKYDSIDLINSNATTIALKDRVEGILKSHIELGHV